MPDPQKKVEASSHCYINEFLICIHSCMRCIRDPPDNEFNWSILQGDPLIVPDGQRPILTGPDMAPYRFQLDIESVYYYHKEKYTYCAVLLRNTFTLGSRMLGNLSILDSYNMSN